MSDKLLLTPAHNSYADIIKAFQQGQPLSQAQIRLLQYHFANLPEHLRTILWQQDDYTKGLAAQKRPLWLTDSLQNQNSLQQLKAKLNLLVANKPQGVEIKFTLAQFLQFKSAVRIQSYQPTLQELIYWHGNQMLTGAPFYPGGVPRLDYFQWGNLYGIVKFEELLGEKVQLGNILIYFEDMQDRKLLQCVQSYYQKLYAEKLSLELNTQTPLPKPQPAPQPTLQSASRPWQPPTLTPKLTPYTSGTEGYEGN